jgi:hypothetical protein
MWLRRPSWAQQLIARSVCCSAPLTCCLCWLVLLLQVIRNPLDVVLSAYQYHSQVGARSGLGACCQCCCRLAKDFIAGS